MDTISSTLAFMEGLGAPEMVVIFVIVLILFGGQKLPEFARGLGKSIREFKKAAAGVEEEFKRALEEDERKAAQAKLTAPVINPLPPAPETPAIADSTTAAPAPSAVDLATPAAPSEPTPGDPEKPRATITPTVLPPSAKPATPPPGTHPDFP